MLFKLLQTQIQNDWALGPLHVVGSLLLRCIDPAQYIGELTPPGTDWSGTNFLSINYWMLSLRSIPNTNMHCGRFLSINQMPKSLRQCSDQSAKMSKCNQEPPSNIRGTDNRLIGIARHWLMSDSFAELLDHTGERWLPMDAPTYRVPLDTSGTQYQYFSYATDFIPSSSINHIVIWRNLLEIKVITWWKTHWFTMDTDRSVDYWVSILLQWLLGWTGIHWKLME
jgi:hypothetical protein